MSLSSLLLLLSLIGADISGVTGTGAADEVDGCVTATGEDDAGEAVLFRCSFWSFFAIFEGSDGILRFSCFYWCWRLSL